VAEGRVDLMQVVKDGKEQPILEVNQVVLNALVSRLGDKLQLPGVEVDPDVSFSR
jgi:hypothetical protein